MAKKKRDQAASTLTIGGETLTRDSSGSWASTSSGGSSGGASGGSSSGSSGGGSQQATPKQETLSFGGSTLYRNPTTGKWEDKPYQAPKLEDFGNANPLSATVQSLTNQRDAIANASAGKNDTLTPYMQRRGLAELDTAIQNQTQRERAEALPRNPITGTLLNPIGDETIPMSALTPVANPEFMERPRPAELGISELLASGTKNWQQEQAGRAARNKVNPQTVVDVRKQIQDIDNQINQLDTNAAMVALSGTDTSESEAERQALSDRRDYLTGELNRYRSALQPEFDALTEQISDLAKRFKDSKDQAERFELFDQITNLNAQQKQLMDALGIENKPIVEWDGRDDLIKEFRQLSRADRLNPAQQARLNEVRSLLEEGDALTGNGLQSYSFGDRVSNILQGSARNVGSTLLNAGATWFDAYSRGQSQQYGLGTAVSDQLAGIDPMSRIEMQTADYNSEESQALRQAMYDTADGIGEKAREDLEKAKSQLGSVGKAGVDIAENVLEMGFDIGFGAMTGGGSLPSMFLRVFGGAAQEARQAGASLDEQLAYAITKGGIEVATEKMFDGVAHIYGAGAADEITEELIRKLADSDTGRTFLRMVISGQGEGIEEVVSDLLDPLAKSIYADESVGELYKNVNPADVLYSYIIGSTIGFFGGATEVATGANALSNAELRMRDAGLGVDAQTNNAWEALTGGAQNVALSPGTEEVSAAARVNARERAARIRLGLDPETGLAPATERTTAAEAPAETVPASEETSPAETAPTVADTLVETLQNKNAETGKVSNSVAEAIINDPELKAEFEKASGVEIKGSKSEQRSIVKDNGDAVISALTGDTAEAPATVAENAPTTPAEPTVANNAPVENNAENSQQIATEQQEGINTPPEAETENVAETPQGETAETATAEAPETALATTPTEEIAPPESNPAGEVIDTETAQLPPAMKRSQTESNTLQSVAGVMGGEQDSLYYIPITEKQTLREAASRVRQDIGGEMEQLMAKEQWTAADIDTAMTIYGILQADGVRNHDFSAAQAWSRVIQPRGTATGQALQAFSKWSRTGQAVFSDAVTEISENPNLTEAQKTQILTDLQSFSDRFDTITQIGEDGEINVKDLRQLIQDLNKYRKTGTFNPKTFGKILDQIQDTEWLQEFALRQLMAARSDFSNNPSLAQRLKTWQVNSQLSRLGTFFRNIGGNMTFGIQDTLAQDFFGVAIDSLVSKKTGQREVAMDKGWLSSSARKSARNALLKSILEVSGDVDMTGEATRYGNTSSRTNKMTGNVFERFMSRWEQLLGYSLTSSDRFSRGQIETSVAEGLMRTNGGNMTQEQAEAIAKQVADYRLFQNDGTAAQFSRSVHDALNKVGVKGPNGESFGLGDLLNPYPGVPANLGVKALEYSPANIIKGGLELHKILSDYKNGVEVETGRQNQAVMNMARGLSGAPAIALFALLFKKGVFKNADDEDDLDAKAQKTAEGQTGVQINLSAMKRTLQGESSDWKDGDDLMSLGWLEPLNAFLAIGSMVADSAEDESFWSMAKEYPQAYLEGSLQSIIDMPVMSNIKNMMDSYNYSNAEDIGGKIGDMALQGAGDAISGMIPAPVGQFAKATDPMQRSTKGDSDFETVVNGIISNIPGLRETLSPKLDAYGNEREYSGTDTQRWLNTFVLPGAINEYSQNDIQKLTDDLYESTGDAAVFPDRKPPSSLKFGSESVKLSTEQQDAYQKKAGETIQNLVDRTTHTSAWNTLTDEEKVSALDGIYKYGEYIAKKEFAEENGYKMSDSVYSKYEKLDDPAEGIIWNNRWSEATANGEQDYVAMDKVISEMNRMSDDVREMMENKDYVQKLEDASALGIGSRDFFITHDFLSGISKAVKEGTPLDYNAIDKGVQQYAKVVDSEEKADVFSSYFSKGDELAEAAKNGMGSEEWFKYYNKYKEVSDLTTDENGDKISANSKHDAFNNFVDMSDISPEQKEMLKGQFTFFTGYTVDDTTYDKMVRGGADPEAAYRWVQEQGDLVPTGDHKSVTSNQKAFVILNDKSLDPADRIEAILNTDGSVVKPNQGEMARWLNSNFSYSEAKYYWSQLQSKFGWSKKTSYEKALHK